MKHLFKYLLVGAIAFTGVAFFVTNEKPQKETVIIREVIEKPAPTTTSTSTTSTTTTTTTTLPPKPSKSSSLMAKVESLYPGASKRYTDYVVRSGAEKACRDYNAGANLMGAIGSLRSYYEEEFSVNDFQLASAVAQSALEVLCSKNNAYPRGYNPIG